MDPQADNDITVEATDTGTAIVWKTQNIRFEHSFIDGELARRARQPEQSILRACSNRKKTIHTLLDLTAGWGLDSFILASHGKQVTMVEKNDVVAGVVKTSLQKLAEYQPSNQALQNITLVQSNALEYLQQLPSPAADCIYLDPMFPSHKSGAKPSKSLQLLQQLTGNEDIDACFTLAMTKAGNRVVVKRPLKANCLHDCVPDQVIKEKTIRFDIYLTS